jgi:DNA-binding protein
MGRNPATGEAIKIKASKKVAFRVAKKLIPSHAHAAKVGLPEVIRPEWKGISGKMYGSFEIELVRTIASCVGVISTKAGSSAAG